MTENIAIEYKQHPNPEDLKQKAILEQDERKLLQQQGKNTAADNNEDNASPENAGQQKEE